MISKKLIYVTVQKIPLGKVSTYGLVAQEVNYKMGRREAKVTPRVVGSALHKNPNPQNIPCHRVVNREGKLAENFAFGGWREQKRRLEKEGITFLNERTVDLAKHAFWG